MSSPSDSNDPQAMAVMVSTKNAVAVTGQSWQWCRAFAVNHGVRVHKAGRKSFVYASDLMEAIKAANDDGRAEADIAEDNVLKIIGKRRRRSA